MRADLSAKHSKENNMLNDAALNVGAEAIADAFPYLSIHTAGAVTSSANESTAPRQPANWAAATAGDLTISAPVEFAGGAAGGPAVRVGYWSAASGGTYGGGALLVGDQTFNAAGEYVLMDLDENATSS